MLRCRKNIAALKRLGQAEACRLIWLGRKDSNPRMPESKSGALTDLATPQLSKADRRTPNRAADGNPKISHTTPSTKKDKPRRFFRFRLAWHLCEHTGTRAGHAGRMIPPQPGNCTLISGKRLQATASRSFRVAFKAKSAILISCVFLVNSLAEKFLCRRYRDVREHDHVPGRRQAYRLHQLAHTFHEGVLAEQGRKARRRPRRGRFRQARGGCKPSPTNGSIPAGSWPHRSFLRPARPHRESLDHRQVRAEPAFLKPAAAPAARTTRSSARVRRRAHWFAGFGRRRARAGSPRRPSRAAGTPIAEGGSRRPDVLPRARRDSALPAPRRAVSPWRSRRSPFIDHQPHRSVATLRLDAPRHRRGQRRCVLG